MGNIILEELIINKNLVCYDFSCTENLNCYFAKKQLFIEYTNDVSNVPVSILSIPFISTFLGIAWLENCNIYVDELDETYYYSLRETRTAYQDMYSEVSLKGRVVPCKIIKNEISNSENSLLLFGGGVDAHSSFIRNKQIISHIINIQGWFKDIAGQDKAADADRTHCVDFAKRMGVEFLYVRSNFSSVINATVFNKRYQRLLHDQWWHGIQHSMAFIGISIVEAFRLGISNLIIASSCTKGRLKPCASFITTDSSYRFAKEGNVLHDAFELNRQQKIKIIVDYQKHSEELYPLKVCSFNDKNCCECEKCFRTILEIVAEGGNIRDYGFNISDSLTETFKNVIERRLALWGIDFELKTYWLQSFSRMKENRANIEDKEFVDWITQYDFRSNKKRCLRNYYRTNFFSILKRKLNIK